MKTLSLENLKPKVDSHSREVFWVTGLAWPKWSLRSLPHSRVMVVLFYLSCFIYLSTSISSQKTSGQQPAGFRGEGGSGNCLIPETILTVFRPHHTSKKPKRYAQEAVWIEIVVMEIVAFVQLLLCPCYCAKHFTRLVPLPLPPHNPVQECCYRSHFTDWEDWGFKRLGSIRPGF